MTWYCAHILVAIVPVEAPTWPQVVHENVYLVEAVDEDAAWEKAESMGRDHAVAQGAVHEGEKVFRSEFAGVRKIISISNPGPLLQDQDPPTSGSEVTY